MKRPYNPLEQVALYGYWTGANAKVSKASARWPFAISTRHSRYRRTHLVDRTVTTWRNGGMERVAVQTKCGAQFPQARIVKECPEAYELCDWCILADFIQPVVYRLFDGVGNLLYIGCTTNLIYRLSSHASMRSSSRRWWSQVARFEFQEYPDHAAALAAEGRAIVKEKPLYNVDRSGRARKPPTYASHRAFLPAPVRAA